jgi:hypothetical protein
MGFIVLYLVFLWKWALIVSLVIGLTGILSAYLGRKIEWIWMKLAMIMGYIFPNIFLSIVFFLFLFPLSLFSKLFRKDPLMLSIKNNTYFINVNRKMDKKSFEKTW